MVQMHHNLFHHSSLVTYLGFFMIINNTVLKIVPYPYAHGVLWITYIRRKLLGRI